MIENQLERCFERPFKFWAEYDSHCILCAWPDVERIALENGYEPRATMKKYISMARKGDVTHSGSPPRNILVFSFTNVTLGKPAASSMVSKDDGVAKGLFGRLRSTMPKSKPSSCEIEIPVPALSKNISSSSKETLP